MAGKGGVMLNEVSQERDKYQMISLVCGIQRIKIRQQGQMKANPWILMANVIFPGGWVDESQ